jgi:hypothetical protein
MPHQVTVTAKTGPDRTNTAIVIPSVTRMDFDLNDKILQVHTETQSGNQIKEYELSAITTVTCTITTGNWAFTLS